MNLPELYGYRHSVPFRLCEVKLGGAVEMSIIPPVMV